MRLLLTYKAPSSRTFGMAAQPLVFPISSFTVTSSGNLSAFAISVGTPPQNFSVLVSTVDDSIVVPFYEGGVQTQNSFKSNDSKTWEATGSEVGANVVAIGSDTLSLTVGGNNSVAPLFGVVLDYEMAASVYGIPSLSYGYTARAAYHKSE
jgi:hypothetical protein